MTIKYDPKEEVWFIPPGVRAPKSEEYLDAMLWELNGIRRLLQIMSKVKLVHPEAE